MIEDSLRDDILAAIASLRAFAMSLTNNRDRADDLVQDTILRAWANIDRFERGTNLNAWLFTILRNQFHSEYRKRKREGCRGCRRVLCRAAQDTPKSAEPSRL